MSTRRTSRGATPWIVATICAGWLIGLASSGGADEPPEPETVDPGSVQGEIDEMIVLGFRTGWLEDDPSAFATVLDLDALLEGERKDLEQVLSETVGVQIRRFGGPGERSEIAIRGFSAAQVVVTLDGVRLNSSGTGSVDLSRIPIDLLETVEVSRGGGSVDVGSGGMGGVVRLRTRRPSEASPTRVKASAGSFGTWNASLFTGKPNDVLDFAIGYDFFRTNGDYEFQPPRYVLPGSGGGSLGGDAETVERINNEHERHSLAFNLGRELGDAGYLVLHQNLGYSSRGEPGVPWCNTQADACQQRHAHSREFSTITNLRWEEIDVGLDDVETEAALSYRLLRNRFKDPEPNLDPDGRDIDVRFEDSTLAADVESIWTGEGLGADHTVTLQLGLDREALETDAEDAIDRSRFGADIMLRDELQLFDGVVRLSPALRLDWTEDFDEQWIPSFGLVVWPWPWIRFKSNVERSFRVPSFDELYLPDQGFISGNPDLDPEEALNFDVGIEFMLDSFGPFRDLRFQAAYFRSDIDNRILWVFVNFFRIEPVNSSDATSDGYELLASLGLSRYLTASVNHTHVDARFDANGSPLPGIAEDETNFRLEIADAGLWKTFGELQSTGAIPVAIGGGQQLSPRKVVNAGAGLNVAALSGLLGHTPPIANLWVAFAANNIADVAVQDSRFFPQPGRNFSLTLEGSW